MWRCRLSRMYIPVVCLLMSCLVVRLGRSNAPTAPRYTSSSDGMDFLPCKQRQRAIFEAHKEAIIKQMKGVVGFTAIREDVHTSRMNRTDVFLYLVYFAETFPLLVRFAPVMLWLLVPH